jgi:hypothetical protein
MAAPWMPKPSLNIRTTSSPRCRTFVPSVIIRGARMFLIPRNTPWPTVVSRTAGAAKALQQYKKMKLACQHSGYKEISTHTHDLWWHFGTLSRRTCWLYSGQPTLKRHAVAVGKRDCVAGECAADEATASEVDRGRDLCMCKHWQTCLFKTECAAGQAHL